MGIQEKRFAKESPNLEGGSSLGGGERGLCMGRKTPKFSRGTMTNWGVKEKVSLLGGGGKKITDGFGRSGSGRVPLLRRRPKQPRGEEKNSQGASNIRGKV